MGPPSKIMSAEKAQTFKNTDTNATIEMKTRVSLSTLTHDALPLLFGDILDRRDVRDVSICEIKRSCPRAHWVHFRTRFHLARLHIVRSKFCTDEMTWFATVAELLL